jgi:hypothetical protein
MLIFTQVPANELGWESGGIDEWRDPPRSRIVAVSLQGGGTLQVLSDDFFAARAPQVSFDGKRVVFAGRQREGDSWQIWEMQSDGSQARQITSGAGACTDPAYLPGGRIVFSGRTDDPEGGQALHTANSDGSDIRRITFHPSADFAPTVLADGRILFASSALSQTPTRSKLMIVRSDGTGIELFHERRQVGRQIGRAWETRDRRVVFVEWDRKPAVGGELVAVSQRRPLYSRVVLSPHAGGTFHSVFPISPAKHIVSYRTSHADRFALYQFDPVEGRVGRLLASDSTYHALEPVAAAEGPVPKVFVTVVDPQKETGILYGLDADLSDLPPASTATPAIRSARLRVTGIQGLLGEVTLEADGSFHLELPADVPVRLHTLDEAGRVVRGPSAWIWVRPNERRGCIGCHENRELAPPNRVPRAIEKPPVSLPSRASPHTDNGSRRSEGTGK